MTASPERMPFSVLEFVAGTIALAAVALIAFAGLRVPQTQDPSSTPPSNAAPPPPTPARAPAPPVEAARVAPVQAVRAPPGPAVRAPLVAAAAASPVEAAREPSRPPDNGGRPFRAASAVTNPITANPSRAKVLSPPALDRSIEFEPKPIAGEELADSANSTFSAWQPVDNPRSTFTQPSGGPRGANTTPQSTDPRSAIARSHPTDNSSVADAPLQTTEPRSPPPTELLNLLRTANATRVQKRLIDTGYLSAPANGIWGARSREALRDFRLANGLGSDDTWDERTQSELFAAPATRAGVTTQPENPQKNEAAAGPRSDPGRNPLKKPDAIWIQTKLRELGYFSDDATGFWGPASRNALRDFKSMNELPADDHWDKDTEQKLASKQSVPASSTFIGGWSDDAGQCQPGDQRNAPLVISSRRATTNRAQCDFQSVERETANRWRIGALCSANGNSWNAKISLDVDGSHLSWSSERGSSNYVRCAMK